MNGTQTTIMDICSRKARIEKYSAVTLYKISKVLGVSMESLIEQEMESDTPLCTKYNDIRSQKLQKIIYPTSVVLLDTAEIVLIGGASVLVNYGFRDMTYDIDAMIHASSSMKDAINRVSDEMGLPNGWLNSDFTRTKSYSPRLVQYSQYYKRFGYVLKVRTVSGEYFVAMKLMSGRQYFTRRLNLPPFSDAITAIDQKVGSRDKSGVGRKQERARRRNLVRCSGRVGRPHFLA